MFKGRKTLSNSIKSSPRKEVKSHRRHQASSCAHLPEKGRFICFDPSTKLSYEEIAYAEERSYIRDGCLSSGHRIPQWLLPSPEDYVKYQTCRSVFCDWEVSPRTAEKGYKSAQASYKRHLRAHHTFHSDAKASRKNKPHETSPRRRWSDPKKNDSSSNISQTDDLEVLTQFSPVDGGQNLESSSLASNVPNQVLGGAPEHFPSPSAEHPPEETSPSELASLPMASGSNGNTAAKNHLVAEDPRESHPSALSGSNGQNPSGTNYSVYRAQPFTFVSCPMYTSYLAEHRQIDPPSTASASGGHFLVPHDRLDSCPTGEPLAGSASINQYGHRNQSYGYTTEAPRSPTGVPLPSDARHSNHDEERLYNRVTSWLASMSCPPDMGATTEFASSVDLGYPCPTPNQQERPSYASAVTAEINPLSSDTTWQDYSTASSPGPTPMNYGNDREYRYPTTSPTAPISSFPTHAYLNRYTRPEWRNHVSHDHAHNGIGSHYGSHIQATGCDFSPVPPGCENESGTPTLTSELSSPVAPFSPSTSPNNEDDRRGYLVHPAPLLCQPASLSLPSRIPTTRYSISDRGNEYLVSEPQDAWTSPPIISSHGTYPRTSYTGQGGNDNRLESHGYECYSPASVNAIPPQLLDARSYPIGSFGYGATSSRSSAQDALPTVPYWGLENEGHPY